jgi:hypothetical protein
MADEIRFGQELTVTNGNQTAEITSSDNADQATVGVIQQKQTVTTGGVTVTFTGLTAARWVMIKNVDATNWVDIGPDSAGSLVGLARLLPGESMQLPLKPSVTVKAIANVASVIIEKTALET